jgi:hypothetical protein
VNIALLIVSDDAFLIGTIVPGQVKSSSLETGKIKCTSFVSTRNTFHRKFSRNI